MAAPSLARPIADAINRRSQLISSAVVISPRAVGMMSARSAVPGSSAPGVSAGGLRARELAFDATAGLRQRVLAVTGAPAYSN